MCTYLVGELWMTEITEVSVECWMVWLSAILPSIVTTIAGVGNFDVNTRSVHSKKIWLFWERGFLRVNGKYMRWNLGLTWKPLQMMYFMCSQSVFACSGLVLGCRKGSESISTAQIFIYVIFIFCATVIMHCIFMSLCLSSSSSSNRKTGFHTVWLLFRGVVDDMCAY